MHTKGILAGSFDPVTRGHEWLISEAARLVDELVVLIAVNPAKKYTFSVEEREAMLRSCLADLDLAGTPVTIDCLNNQLTVKYASKVGATHLVRGIRNLTDFSYETDIAAVNRKLNPNIRSVYIVTPPELTQVSSSTVKGFISFEGWEDDIRDYVHPQVLEAFRRKQAERSTG